MFGRFARAPGPDRHPQEPFHLHDPAECGATHGHPCGSLLFHLEAAVRRKLGPHDLVVKSVEPSRLQIPEPGQQLRRAGATWPTWLERMVRRREWKAPPSISGTWRSPNQLSSITVPSKASASIAL